MANSLILRHGTIFRFAVPSPETTQPIAPSVRQKRDTLLIVPNDVGEDNTGRESAVTEPLQATQVSGRDKIVSLHADHRVDRDRLAYSNADTRIRDIGNSARELDRPVITEHRQKAAFGNRYTGITAATLARSHLKGDANEIPVSRGAGIEHHAGKGYLAKGDDHVRQGSKCVRRIDVQHALVEPPQSADMRFCSPTNRNYDFRLPGNGCVHGVT